MTAMKHSPSRHERTGLIAVCAGLPKQAGVGFKAMHCQALLVDERPPAFVEVHAENLMGAGGAPHAQMQQVRERMALSLHGVGLSIGGPEPLDVAHLDRLATLIRRYRPESFSEHLAWSSHGATYFNDLLPIAYEPSALARVCAHIDQVQNHLGVRMLLENPSTYVAFEASAMPEPEFIAEVLRRTGCGLLLDVNNVHVTCSNHRLDAQAYIDALPLEAVGEIHLAGHSIDAESAQAGDTLLIDDHGSPVADPVWALYASVLERIGPTPTLIEWDNHVPDYTVLRAEADKADRMMATQRARMTGKACA